MNAHDPREDALRRRLVACGRGMRAAGLVTGTAGNLCVRVPDGLLVSPSGRAVDALTEDDLLRLDMQGRTVGGRGRPTSEWRIHRDVLAARPEVGAVVHAHPPHATAVACLREDLPAFHYMVAVAGGDTIRCAPYATFGTQALSDHALAALADRRACLLANHGILALGPTPEAALDLAIEVEGLAATWLAARAAGTPVLLGPEAMREVLERFRDYGAHAGDDAAPGSRGKEGPCTSR